MIDKLRKKLCFILAAALIALTAMACTPKEKTDETRATPEVHTTEAEDSESEETTEKETEDPLEPFKQELTEKYGDLFMVTESDKLNVRAEMSTDSEIVGTIARNGMGTVLEVTNGSEWLKVRSGEVEGYVYEPLVLTGEEALKKAALFLSKMEEDETIPEGETVESTEAESESQRPSSGITVCIDAGHQAHGISETEPIGPGSTVMKAKLATGTQGRFTGVPEHVVTLQVSLKLQKILETRGYNVVMIRTTENCTLSNKERAEVANASGAQAFIRIHCNGVDDSTVRGVINYVPGTDNTFVPQNVIAPSINLGTVIGNYMCAATGAQNRGVLGSNEMSGINWCKIPVTILEMGFMTNEQDDRLLCDDGYQTTMATGIANGIDAYFGR